jgi:hypothetical protein
MKPTNRIHWFFAILLVVALACNVPSTASEPTQEPVAVVEEPVTEVQPSPEATTVPSVTHVDFPAVDFGMGKTIYDTESSGTAPEQRAPYGDTYEWNFLERPFLADMTYVPDLDIHFFSMSKDDLWHYVSIKLIGTDPNNPLGIHYSVELDTDKDGFGNFIIVAQPPYSSEWTTENVQVFADENRDTSGISPIRSDAPFSGDGYETLLFDGAQGFGDDPDLAWVRVVNTTDATIQFAFKRSLAGDVFMAGVMADAGLRDVSQRDYVDRFTEAEAGSPVRSKQYYPLYALHSVDNTCREAFGFAPSGYEPMICPRNVAPAPGGSGGGGGGSSGPSPTQPTSCVGIGPSDCAGTDSPFFWPYPHCACSSQPFYESPP